VAFTIAFTASLVLAFFLRGTPENPHRLGGFAVLGGLICGAAFGYGWATFYTLRVFWMTLGLLIVMGAVDDWIRLRPRTKFLFQLAAAVLFLLFTSPSTWGGDLTGWVGWLAYPVWLFWLVGITNSLNLLDNMDGLTSGVGLLAALGFVWLGLGANWILLPLAGALLAFLLLNFHPARIYLGDAGSHLVGFTLAAIPLYGLSLQVWWVPIAVLGVPIADTSFVTVSRLRRGVSPFLGGKDHLSHRIVRTGIPEPFPVLILYLATVLLIFVAHATV
jgi:UDP-GlcNAc:undecaprenyl-phosphate/decaprenyl-phosphate GlcNAc-1-phosphate transferase